MERPATTWQARPGWGIAVDLTPHEVVQARQVRVTQLLIGLALLLVLAVCLGVTLLVRADRAAAESVYDQEQGRTAQLATDAEAYSGITTMQTVTAQVEANLAAVMSTDVDVVNLMAQIRASLPAGLTVTTESIVLSPPVVAPAAEDGAAAGDGAAEDGAAAEAPTGSQVIGSVSIAGTGPTIADVTPLIASLNQLSGVVDVVPTSVTQGELGMNYTVSMNITDVLYTNRFTTAGPP